MMITITSSRWLAWAGTVLVLTGCGGGSSSSPPTQQQRIAAATTTVANNAACTSITPFYWEIGDANNPLASGTGGDNSSTAPDPATFMSVASASKWLFSTYVVEKQSGVLSAGDISYLHFQSGYVNFNSCSNTSTVASCLTETGAVGGTNGDHSALADGKFFYGGGHMQLLASTMSLAPDYNAGLTTDMQSVLGANIPLLYTQPQLAGGAAIRPNDYAQFLRNLLGGTTYPHMSAALGTDAVCTHTNSTDCPSALFSPINESALVLTNDVTDEAWHYSLGHWVEDDPVVGDGAFSSPGRFGFYPWIDNAKTYYGILARFDTANVSNPDPTKASYITSVFCGRLIRKAWKLGQAQN